MKAYLSAAAVLALVVGVVHSVLGERLVFSRLRQGGWVPTHGGNLLRAPHARILWVSWHFVTAIGWAVAAALPMRAAEPAHSALHIAFLRLIGLSMLALGALVLVGTRGRHPGWLGLLGVDGLTWLGLPA